MSCDTKIAYSIEPFGKELIERFQSAVGIDFVCLDRSSFFEQKELHSSIEILLCRDRDDISKILDVCNNLKFMFIMSAGVEKLPFGKLRNRNVVVANIGGLNAPIMSEYAMSYILSTSTRMIENYENQKKHIWKKYQNVIPLTQKNLLIVGTGHIGKLIAKKAKSFDMNVVGIKKHISSVDFFDKIYGLKDLDYCLSFADFVVVCTPLTELTKGIFNKDRFSSMKEDAVFINISRGGLVCQDDLVDALKSGTIKSAVLDVFEKEPLEYDSPLWDIPNLIVTPHCSGRLPNFMSGVIDFFIENTKAFIGSQSLPNKVNLDEGY